MGGLIHQRNRTEKSKRFKAIAAAAGSGVALVGLGSTLLFVAGLAVTGYLTYDWFMFRAKNGMRF